MSGRTITRIATVAILSIAAAVPIGAQYPYVEPAPSSLEPTATTAMQKLSGTWYRQCDGYMVAATFTPDELKVSATLKAGETQVRFLITADYAVTKDGLVHGAITGVDWKVQCKQEEKEAADREITSRWMEAWTALVGCPFSFRIRSTSAGMMVSKLQADVNESMHKGLSLMCGMYRLSKDGTLPAFNAPGSSDNSFWHSLVGATCEARYIQKGPDSGVITIPEDTNVWPTYYHDAAIALIKAHIGQSYEVIEQYEVEVGEKGSGKIEFRLVYRKKPINP